MSKSEGKRGFAPSQREAASTTKEWDDARAQLVAAHQAHEAGPDAGNGADPAYNHWQDARDRLLSTPAPNGEALAVKIGLFGYPLISDRFDPATGQFSPERARQIIDQGTEDEKALLALYFDALALSGVRATVTPPVITAGDSAIAGSELAKPAQDRSRPAYLNHPGLQAYADAWEATEAQSAGDDDGERRVAELSDKAGEIVVEQVYNVPAQTVDDVIAKLAAFIAAYNGGKISPRDPTLFKRVYGDSKGAVWSLPGASVLAGIVLELQRIMPPSPSLFGDPIAAHAIQGLERLSGGPRRAAWAAAVKRVEDAWAAYGVVVAKQLADDGEDRERAKALAAEIEPLVDAWYDALAALDATPAPHLEGLAYKLRQSLALTYGSTAEEFDDPLEFMETFVEAKRTNGQIGFFVYTDILRLLGSQSPVLTVPLHRASANAAPSPQEGA